MLKLASSTMFKLVNNTIQAGLLNHAFQACQQHYSSWPAQPCSSLSTTLFKLASSTMFQACQQHYSSWPVQLCFKPVNRQKQALRFYVRSSMVRTSISLTGNQKATGSIPVFWSMKTLSDDLSLTNDNPCMYIIAARHFKALSVEMEYYFI